MTTESNHTLAASLIESIPLTDTIAPPINHALILGRLADVQLPAEPVLWPIFAFSGAVLVIIAFIALSYRRRQSIPPVQTNNNQQQALERLTIVENAWTNGDIDAREAAYRLSTLLRLGLNLPQLNHHCPAALADNNQAWQQTLALFNQLRYPSHTATQQPLTLNTFAQLRWWLSAAQHPNRDEKNV
ncbi:MAG: hypothetical protein COB33_009355 [Thiotrichaceae bacterium]|nr:hypothetical protein [Thiotrichaceae bacterium]